MGAGGESGTFTWGLATPLASVQALQAALCANDSVSACRAFCPFYFLSPESVLLEPSLSVVGRKLQMREVPHSLLTACTIFLLRHVSPTPPHQPSLARF